MAKLKVQLDLGDTATAAEGHLVHVVLRDTSMADALHPAVAEATGTVEDGVRGTITLDVPDDALSERGRYSLFAHVDRHGDGEIHTGDMITTEDIRVEAADVTDDAAPVRAPVVQI